MAWTGKCADVRSSELSLIMTIWPFMKVDTVHSAFTHLAAHNRFSHCLPGLDRDCRQDRFF